MKTLYIISGPAGVGKSTISKKIAKSLKKSVLIEGDEIYHQVISGFIPAWENGNHLELFLKNSIDLINNYINYEYDVVFNYVLDEDNIKEMVDKIHNVKIKFICLMTSEDELLKRDSQRIKSNRMNDRCLILLNHFKEMNFNEDNILDTTNLTIEEIVLKIVKEDKFNIKQ